MLAHEDSDVHIDFFDRGYCDLFIHSFHHNSNSLFFYLSKTLDFDDPFYDEVETPQAVEELQPELMVMSGSRSLELSSTTDQNFFESPQTLCHSLVHIENQSRLQFFTSSTNMILSLKHWRRHT